MEGYILIGHIEYNIQAAQGGISRVYIERIFIFLDFVYICEKNVCFNVFFDDPGCTKGNS